MASWGKKMLEASLKKHQDTRTAEGTGRKVNSNLFEVDPDDPFDVYYNEKASNDTEEDADSIIGCILDDSFQDPDIVPGSESESSCSPYPFLSSTQRPTVMEPNHLHSTPTESASKSLQEVESALPSQSTPKPNSPNVSQKSKKPKWPCFFCGRMQAQLVRHLKRAYKDEIEVQQAVKQPRVERLRAFNVIKKKGIYAHNIALTRNGSGVPLERERKQGTDDLALCNGCKGFFSQKRICQHRKTCLEAQGQSTKSGSLNVKFLGDSSATDDVFHKEIIQRFRNDETGLLCQTDCIIVMMGRKLWAKSARKDKRVIMNDMRTLGNLVLECRKIAGDNSLMAKNIVDRKNFEHLTEAIHSLMSQNGNLKAGLKLAIGFLLKKTDRVLKGFHIQENDMHAATEVDHFAALLDLNWDFIFYKAQLACEQRRQNLRKPVDMPLERDLTKFRNFILDETTKLINDNFNMWDRHDFVYMRNLLVSRLTLFNARRGGEPARMLLSEWEEAQDGSWIDRQQVEVIQDPVEKELVSGLKLAYQSGKGSRRLVPVLFPKDTLPAIEKLLSERERCGVCSDNQFLFPNTGMSDDHVIGWNSIQSITKLMGDKLERPELLIADKFRHRTSTMFSLLEIPRERRELFYRHMGHSEQMNRDVYQCPLAIREVTEVGGFLQNIDERTSQQTVHVSLTSSQNIEEVPSSSNASEEILPLVEESQEKETESISQQVYERNGVDSDFRTDKKRKDGDNQSRIRSTRNRRYFKWSDDQTRRVRSHFKGYISDVRNNGTKGALPSKSQILAFLEKSGLFHECDMAEGEKISLIKTKVFNERTKERTLVSKLFSSDGS